MTNIAPSLNGPHDTSQFTDAEITEALRYGDGSYPDLRSAAVAPDYAPKHDLAPVFISLANRHAKARFWARIEGVVLAIGYVVLFGMLGFAVWAGL